MTTYDLSNVLPWYDHRKDLLELFTFLTDIGLEPEMPLFLEKPEKWQKEYELMKMHPSWRDYSSDKLDDLSSRVLNIDD